MLDKHLIAPVRPKALEGNQAVWRECRITVLTDRLFRIEKDSTHTFCDEATQTVWYRDMPQVSYKAECREEEIKIVTARATLVWKGNSKESFVLLEGKQVPISNEGNLLGTYRTLDECNGDMWIHKDNKGNAPQPCHISLGIGVVSQSGAAVVEDSDSLLLKADGTLGIRENREEDFYLFAYGHDYRGAVKALFKICGAAPVIPRYALGNWWSRYHAYTEKEYLHVLDRFAERRIPFTVATVDMDWHWSTTLDEVKGITEQGKNDEWHGGNSGWTGYSWNTDLFPDYKRFLKKLHDRGLKVTLNLHPADGVRCFEDMYEEMAEAMGIDAATEKCIPFDIADQRFVNAYFKILHKPYEHDGVDFWWIDWQQGNQSSMEGLDPLWALNHYHYLDNGLEKEPLILSRYCGVGSHRYPLGFSGDTHVTWETLDYLPYFTATASNIGYTWWSHDIGGHMMGYKDDELYVRFVQFGVFSPINRLHSSNSPIFTKEPTAYKNGTGLIVEEFLRLRHRLIPFLYSASRETAEEGLALIEPMYYAYPETQEAYECRNQYLFGRQLLAAPITHKSGAEGMAVKEVWLPEGRWTDIFTGDEYRGNQWVKMVRFLDSIPVLGKEGGFLVLDGRGVTNNPEAPDSLVVKVFSGNGSYILHEEMEETAFSQKVVDENTLKLSFRRNGKGNNSGERRYRFEFSNILTGDVKVYSDGAEREADVDDNSRLSVELDKVEPGVLYEIIVNYCSQENEKLITRIREAITSLQMDNNKKQELYDRLSAGAEENISDILDQYSLTEEQRLRLLEQYSMECIGG